MAKVPRHWGKVLVGVALVAGLAGAACSSSGVSQEAYDSKAAEVQAKAAEVEKASAQIKAKEQELAQLQQKLAGVAPVTVVQAGQLQPAPAGQAFAGWDNAESARGGLKLIATYDSSGPDAWDVKAHPNVYFTSEGGNNLFAGLHVIDSYSKQVIAAAQFQLGEYKVSPHTTGVSPDGKWAYLQGGRTVDVGGKPTNEDVTLIINARTLKLDKILKQQSMFQGAMRVQRLHHVMSFVDSKGNDRVVLQYGFGSNGGPHFLLDPKDNNRVVQTITVEDTGYWMGHPFLTADPTGKYLYVSLKVAAWGEETEEIGGIAKINLETRAVTVIPGVGRHPIGISHTADGKFTYVIDGEGSMVFKIDNATNEVVGKTSAGVAGPYGACMNWDETELYAVGKGEGSHNTGSVLGVVDLKDFRTKRGITNPIYLGGTGKVASIDHCFLHPDKDVNEIWVSNMAGDETIVVDLKTRTVKAYIPTPNGGNTHSGAFVKYNADWTGRVLADHGGPQKELYATRTAVIKAAAAAVPAAK
ncbi:MAG: YncE family protein [Chloroflexi bacterium]|nr:YncE family protein [Chloroflexota bacterium]